MKHELDITVGDIWNLQPYSSVIVPTNGFVKITGECVMGAGLAKQAKRRYPKLPYQLGQLIKDGGNNVYVFPQYLVYSFPVKHNWWEKADLKLIEKSAIQLKGLIKVHPYSMTFAMPKVGCGNGQLDWKDVEPIIKEHLWFVRIVDNNRGRK